MTIHLAGITALVRVAKHQLVGSEPDIEEYGSCYCNLYVSKEWNEGSIPHEYVPER